MGGPVRWCVSQGEVTRDGLTHHQARENEWPPQIVMTIPSRTMTVRSRTAGLPATCEVAPLNCTFRAVCYCCMRHRMKNGSNFISYSNHSGGTDTSSLFSMGAQTLVVNTFPARPLLVENSAYSCCFFKCSMTV